MKIALVYDRVNKFGGAERVLLALHELYPEAPLFTSVYHPGHAPWAKNFRVIPSFLQKWPLAAAHHEALVMLMPQAFASFDFSAYDLVISVTSAEAKGIITRPPTKHLCYLLTPTRYLWSHTNQYLGHGLGKLLKLPLMTKLRLWDYEAAQKPDYLIAISETVKKRIIKYYHRTVQNVIYPPVEVEKFTSHPDRCFHPGENYYLVVARLVPYKNVELVINTFKSLPEEKLIIVGTGSALPALKSLAGPNIQFVGAVSDDKLSCLYHHAQALIFPQEEDFGLVAVEAQAAGLPVIAWNRGGARETVVPGVTGVLYDNNSEMGLNKAIREAKKFSWNREEIHVRAEKYSVLRFQTQFKQFVEAYVSKQ